MNTSFKLLLGGIFIAIIFLLSGCTVTSYYGGYYDPYPYWGYRGYRSVHHYHHRPNRPHRPGGGKPSIGRPVQLPSRPGRR